MIEYKDIQRFENLPFETYLSLEGYSHSFCKYETNGLVAAKKVTDKMLFGKLVDNILTGGEAVSISDPMYNEAKHVAAQIKSTFGTMFHLFKFQLSYKAVMCFGEFYMPTIGRPDCELPLRATIDFKVTDAKNIPDLIAFMGYENQVWHYSKLGKTKEAYILPYSRPLKKCLPLHRIDVSKNNEWWEDKIIKFGKVA
jgi:hypothetical protein